MECTQTLLSIFTNNCSTFKNFASIILYVCPLYSLFPFIDFSCVTAWFNERRRGPKQTRLGLTWVQWSYWWEVPIHPGGCTLGISGWGCATRTLEPLAYTRASFSWILLPFTRLNSPNHSSPRVAVFQKLRSLVQSKAKPKQSLIPQSLLS